jgi:hypothetical protein
VHQITNHPSVLLDYLLFHVHLMSRLLGLHRPGNAMSMPKVSLGKGIINPFDLHQETEDRVILPEDRFFVEYYLQGPLTLEGNGHMIEGTQMLELTLRLEGPLEILGEHYLHAV